MRTLKITRVYLCSLTILLTAACIDAGAPHAADKTTVAQSEPALGLVPVFGGRKFERPLAMYQAPGAEDWFVVEQAGRVFRLSSIAGREASVFIDIRDRVDDGPNEAGLLGMAFHPDYANNRQFFLSYTRSDGQLESVITRLTASPDGRRGDPSTERIVLEIYQPYSNHNGGQIAFGPDGFLYAGFGDGGAGGDPEGNGQNTETLLGAMLRIDVDRGAPYAIPADNPFASGGGRPEIFAWGLRNPWRWSFDRKTGELWAGDVGQNRYEEIDLIRKGGNYGWNVREAASRFSGPSRPDMIEPVASYSQNFGCSVTGGYVYRGTEIALLQGVYLFGDFCSGRIWGLPRGGGTAQLQTLIDSELNIASFAEGHDGTLYVIDLGGRIYRIAAANR